MAIKKFFLFVMRTFFHRICQEGFVYNSIKDIECFCCCCWFSLKFSRRWRKKTKISMVGDGGKKRKRLLKIDSVCIFQMNLNILIPCLTVFLWHLIFFCNCIDFSTGFTFFLMTQPYRKTFHTFLHDFLPI